MLSLLFFGLLLFFGGMLLFKVFFFILGVLFCGAGFIIKTVVFFILVLPVLLLFTLIVGNVFSLFWIIMIPVFGGISSLFRNKRGSF